MTATDQASPQPIWHPNVHSHIAEEELYFLFINFFGDFDQFRKLVTNLLDEKCNGRYGLFVVFGDFDLAIRVWAQRVEFLDIKKQLQDLGRLVNGAIEVFTVESTHYLWAEGPTDLSGDVLDELRADRTVIMQLQAGSLPKTRLDWCHEHRVVLGDLTKRHSNPTNSRLMSFILFKFVREPTDQLQEIVREELFGEIQQRFGSNGDEISVYFGSGLGSLLVEHSSATIERFNEFGDFLRRRLRLLRPRSSTYIVGNLVAESDNCSIVSESPLSNVVLTEEGQAFVRKYPAAERMQVEDFYVALAIEAHAAVCVEKCSCYGPPFAALLEGFVRRDRSKLFQAVGDIEKVVIDKQSGVVKRIAKSNFGDDWEEKLNAFIRGLGKNKDVERLSLGEYLHLIRELAPKFYDYDSRSFVTEWQEKAERFIGVRNDFTHRNRSGFERAYEVARSIEDFEEALVSLDTMLNVQRQEGDSQ